MIIGFLSPTGEFTECNTYRHMDCADAICRKMGKEFFSSYFAEEYLLDIGYVRFRKYDVWMSVIANNGKINTLTDAQIKFINDNQGNWETVAQMNSLERMLKEEQYARSSLNS